MDIKKITTDNFEQEIMQAKEPVLVDFYADWCGYCQAIAPVLDELAQENTVQIAKIDVDANPELAQRYAVMTIPTLALFKDGQIVDKRIGSAEKEELKEMVK